MYSQNIRKTWDARRIHHVLGCRREPHEPLTPSFLLFSSSPLCKPLPPFPPESTKWVKKKVKPVRWLRCALLSIHSNHGTATTTTKITCYRIQEYREKKFWSKKSKGLGMIRNPKKIITIIEEGIISFGAVQSEIMCLHGLRPRFEYDASLKNFFRILYQLLIKKEHTHTHSLTNSIYFTYGLAFFLQFMRSLPSRW